MPSRLPTTGEPGRSFETGSAALRRQGIGREKADGELAPGSCEARAHLRCCGGQRGDPEGGVEWRVQVGPVRESPARPSSKELATVQLEGTGPVPAVMGLLSRLESVGFPLIIDSVQLTPDMRPGQLKVNLTILILDFDQWTKEGSPHA